MWCTTLLGHHRFCRCHQLAEVRDELERVRAEKAALEVQVAQLQQQLDDRQASLTEVRGYLTLTDSSRQPPIDGGAREGVICRPPLLWPLLLTSPPVDILTGAGTAMCPRLSGSPAAWPELPEGVLPCRLGPVGLEKAGRSAHPFGGYGGVATGICVGLPLLPPLACAL